MSNIPAPLPDAKWVYLYDVRCETPVKTPSGDGKCGRERRMYEVTTGVVGARPVRIALCPACDGPLGKGRA